jgi:hypothetical protein
MGRAGRKPVIEESAFREAYSRIFVNRESQDVVCAEPGMPSYPSLVRALKGKQRPEIFGHNLRPPNRRYRKFTRKEAGIILTDVLHQRANYGREKVPSKMSFAKKLGGAQSRALKPTINAAVRCVERCLSYVGSADPITGCRVWRGPLRKNLVKGKVYITPRIFLPGADSKRFTDSRRILWTVGGKGNIDGRLIKMSCRTPLCVAVDHIIPGVKRKPRGQSK